MDDLLVSLDDYRELATFLEEKIAEASEKSPDEVGELSSRLVRLHEMLGNPDPAVEHAEHLRRDNFEAEAFELKMKRKPPAELIEELERIVLQDIGDDNLRKRYLETAQAMGAQLRAAEALNRALPGATRPDVKERVGFDVALLYLGEGELPQARSAFLDVVRAGAAGPFALSAARRLLNLQVDPSDPELVGPARELIAKADPEPTVRRESAEAILALHASTPQPESRLAVAYRAFVGSPRTDEAIQWLRRFYAAQAEKDGLVEWLEHAEHWEPLAKVLAADLELAPQKDRGRLYARLGHVRLVRLNDASGAAMAFGRALSLDPVGAPDATLAAIALAYANLRDRDRHDLMLRTARTLSRNGKGARAIALCKELFVEPTLEPSVVQEIAEIAHDEDDKDLHRHALDLLARVGDVDVRKRALERLGDFQFTQLGDRRAAAESWRPAARLYDGMPAEKEHAQQLYERVLEALPDDRDAAQRLAEIYAQSDDWGKLPDVLRVLVRTDTDGEACAALLLRLEKSAVEAGEVAQFASLIEEVIGRLGSEPSKALVALKRARARALASDTARSPETTAAYREIIESSGSEEDVRAFEAFVESLPSVQERHQERRWLYEWRVKHGTRPAEMLLEWARAEEELGETEAAIAVYVRLSELAPGQREGLEALCRLKLHTGDFEGGLAALRSLRETGTDAERQAVTLQMARVLLEDLGRPAETAVALAPLLDVVPPIPSVRQMMKRTLADPSARAQVAEHIERLSRGEDAAAAKRVLQFLIEARHETAPMKDARRRWFERLVELSLGDRKAALSIALQGAVEQPEATSLWEHAERIVRELKAPEMASGVSRLSKAYHDALVERGAEPEVAEAVARRMIAFSSECGLPDSPQLVEALQKFLEVAPGARWALDRVKLVLGSQARWDELFRLYDGAIAATTSDVDRGQLLDEAACAAKDLASQPERAIPYLESIHKMRPDDPTAAAALERLYERQGRTRVLIDLLGERLDKTSGFKRRELLDRIASLWLDIGEATQAFDVVKRTMADGATVADVTGLLERIAVDATVSPDAASSSGPSAAETKRRAVELLRDHYQGLERMEDVVRMAVRQLALAEGAVQRSKCVRDLIDVCLRSRSAFEPRRRRGLLREGARICADRLEDREGAIRLYTYLFEEDAADDVATEAVEAYATLLEAAGELPKLARFWEAQAHVHAAAMRPAMQRACWERAGKLWELQGSRSDAVSAYEQAAALDSEEAFEGLAKIHQSGGEWAPAAKALEWLYAHSAPTTRGLRALEVAQAYVALGDRDRARSRLEQALEAGVEPERAAQVSDTLIALYRKDGVYGPLARRLVLLAGATRDPDKKLALLLEAADLFRTKAEAPGEAVALLEKAVALRPSDGALRPSLAQVLEALERWDRAAEVLRDQIGWYGSQRTRERALTHHRLATVLLRAGRQKEALVELRLAAEMLPAHPGVLHHLGRAALDAGDLELAEGTYRALLLALHHPAEDVGVPAPHRAEVFLDLSEIALRNGDGQRAADLVDSAVDVALESGDRPERFEPVMASRGRYDLLARAIERRVDRATTLAARAVALGDLVDVWSKHLGRAEDLRARVVHHVEGIGQELEQEGTADAVAWAALASVHASLGDEAESAAANQRLGTLLESAIAKATLGPERARLRVSFAKATMGDASQLDRTIAMLSAALEDEPTNGEAVELLSDALCRAGKLDEARQVIEKLLAKDPTNAGGLEKLASLAAAASDWEGAIDAYRKLLPGAKEAGVVSRLALAMSDACDRAGKPDEARDALERALGLAPQSIELTERLTLICERTGDWARLTHLWVAQAEKQESPGARAQLLVRGGSLLLEKAHAPAEALRLAELARTASAESVEASVLWAQAQQALGRPKEALLVLLELVERNRGKRSSLGARVCLEAARAHLALDELLEAFDLLKTAFGMDARNGEIAMLLALVALDVDDERTAERALFAITGTPARGDADRRAQATAFFHLAAAAHARGDGGKARRFLGKALVSEPGHKASQELLERLDLSGSAVVHRSALGTSPKAAVTPRS